MKCKLKICFLLIFLSLFTLAGCTKRTKTNKPSPALTAVDTKQAHIFGRFSLDNKCDGILADDNIKINLVEADTKEVSTIGLKGEGESVRMINVSPGTYRLTGIQLSTSKRRFRLSQEFSLKKGDLFYLGDFQGLHTCPKKSVVKLKFLGYENNFFNAKSDLIEILNNSKSLEGIAIRDNEFSAGDIEIPGKDTKVIERIQPSPEEDSHMLSLSYTLLGSRDESGTPDLVYGYQVNRRISFEGLIGKNTMKEYDVENLNFYDTVDNVFGLLTGDVEGFVGAARTTGTDQFAELRFRLRYVSDGKASGYIGIKGSSYSGQVEQDNVEADISVDSNYITFSPIGGHYWGENFHIGVDFIALVYPLSINTSIKYADGSSLSVNTREKYKTIFKKAGKKIGENPRFDIFAFRIGWIF